MTKLWSKGGDAQQHPAVNSYIVGRELEADSALLTYDVQASIAHGAMLAKVGILTKDEAAKLSSKLAEILALQAQGKFTSPHRPRI